MLKRTPKNWDSLSAEEQSEIKTLAMEAQDRAKRFVCCWCGSPLASMDYDYTADPQGNRPREICKGVCKRKRFFDNSIDAYRPEKPQQNKTQRIKILLTTFIRRLFKR